MTTINADLYDALITAKVPEEKARAAAKTDPERAQTTARFNVFMWICGVFVFPLLISLTSLSLYVGYETRKDVARLEVELKVELTELRGEMTAMKADLRELKANQQQTMAILREIKTALPVR